MSIVLTGFWPFIGETLDVYLGGLDCGSYVVAADGTVTVPYQSDPDELLTATYLKALSDAGIGVATEHPAVLTVTISAAPVDVTVPLCVGYTYNSDGQLTAPDDQKESHTQTGPALGKKRRVHQFAVKLVDTIGISFGTDFARVDEQVLKTDGGTSYNKATGFTGTHRNTIDATTNYDNMLCWRISRPYPATISSLSGFLETSES